MMNRKIITISDKPLLCYPRMAYQLKSADKALILQQLIYWQDKSSHFKDGYYWIYNTIKDWKKQFPWLSERTIARHLKSLEDDGYIVTGNYNQLKFDRTKWYRINKERVDVLDSPYCQSGNTIMTNCPNENMTSCPNENMTSCPNQYQRLPETTTEITTDKRNIKESSKQLSAGTSSDHIPYSEIIDYLNEKAGTKYRATSQKTRKLIRARFNEKFTLDDFKQVIDTKTSQWLNDPKMSKYLRPETLFGTKFENYLNEMPKKIEPERKWLF